MTILLTDKKVATILEPRHMLELVDEYMGTDVRMWFEDYLAGADCAFARYALPGCFLCYDIVHGYR